VRSNRWKKGEKDNLLVSNEDSVAHYDNFATLDSSLFSALSLVLLQEVYELKKTEFKRYLKEVHLIRKSLVEGNGNDSSVMNSLDFSFTPKRLSVSIVSSLLSAALASGPHISHHYSNMSSSRKARPIAMNEESSLSHIEDSNCSDVMNDQKFSWSNLLQTIVSLEKLSKNTAKYKLEYSDSTAMNIFDRCSRALHPMNQIPENEDVSLDEKSSKTNKLTSKKAMNEHVVKFKLLVYGRYVSIYMNYSVFRCFNESIILNS
jgi:uncharacterized membrane protein